MEFLLGQKQGRLFSREKGGLLFAAVTEGPELLITRATPPHAEDQSSYESLRLAPNRCAKEIDDAYADGLHFVGYWHSHPERNPSLSAADMEAFTHNLKSDGVTLGGLLAVIVGSTANEERLCVAVVLDPPANPIQLQKL